MILQFTKFGFINALWSLIPISIWTLIPMIGIEKVIEKCTGDCVLSFEILLWLSIGLIVAITAVYLLNIDKILLNNSSIDRNFKLVCLVIYSLVNISAMIIMLGAYKTCYGSSMSIMVVVFTCPTASLSLLIFGFIIDLKIKIAGTLHKNIEL